MCLGSSLVWISEEYTPIFSERCRSTAGSSPDEKILVWTPCRCSLQRDLLLCLKERRNHRNPGSLREPCFLQWPCAAQKQEEVAAARGFFVVQFVKLCFITSTGHYLRQNSGLKAEKFLQPLRAGISVYSRVLPAAIWDVWNVLMAPELRGPGALSPSPAFMVKQKILINHQQLQIQHQKLPWVIGKASGEA